jgi:hypothetical protein
MGKFLRVKRSLLGKVLGLLALLALVGIGVSAAFPPVLTLRLSYQKTGEVIMEQTVQPGDSLTVELTHSFEHVPWNEYYQIQSDGTFLLQRIEVGGFGAGIPAEMDVPTYVGEDGLVHMDDINTIFPYFNWITSQTNMKDLLLNDQPIFTFQQIPHHSFVTCEIQVQRRLFCFG